MFAPSKRNPARVILGRVVMWVWTVVSRFSIALVTSFAAAVLDLFFLVIALPWQVWLAAVIIILITLTLSALPGFTVYIAQLLMNGLIFIGNFLFVTILPALQPLFGLAIRCIMTVWEVLKVVLLTVVDELCPDGPGPTCTLMNSLFDVFQNIMTTFMAEIQAIVIILVTLRQKAGIVFCEIQTDILSTTMESCLASWGLTGTGSDLLAIRNYFYIWKVDGLWEAANSVGIYIAKIILAAIAFINDYIFPFLFFLTALGLNILQYLVGLMAGVVLIMWNLITFAYLSAVASSATQGDLPVQTSGNLTEVEIPVPYSAVDIAMGFIFDVYDPYDYFLGPEAVVPSPGNPDIVEYFYNAGKYVQDGARTALMYAIELFSFVDRLLCSLAPSRIGVCFPICEWTFDRYDGFLVEPLRKMLEFLWNFTFEDILDPANTGLWPSWGAPQNADYYNAMATMYSICLQITDLIVPEQEIQCICTTCPSQGLALTKPLTDAIGGGVPCDLTDFDSCCIRKGAQYYYDAQCMRSQGSTWDSIAWAIFQPEGFINAPPPSTGRPDDCTVIGAMMNPLYEWATTVGASVNVEGSTKAMNWYDPVSKTYMFRHSLGHYYYDPLDTGPGATYRRFRLPVERYLYTGGVDFYQHRFPSAASWGHYKSYATQFKEVQDSINPLLYSGSNQEHYDDRTNFFFLDYHGLMDLTEFDSVADRLRYILEIGVPSQSIAREDGLFWKSKDNRQTSFCKMAGITTTDERAPTELFDTKKYIISASEGCAGAVARTGVCYSQFPIWRAAPSTSNPMYNSKMVGSLQRYTYCPDNARIASFFRSTTHDRALSRSTCVFFTSQIYNAWEMSVLYKGLTVITGNFFENVIKVIPSAFMFGIFGSSPTIAASHINYLCTRYAFAYAYGMQSTCVSALTSMRGTMSGSFNPNLPGQTVQWLGSKAQYFQGSTLYTEWGQDYYSTYYDSVHTTTYRLGTLMHPHRHLISKVYHHRLVALEQKDLKERFSDTGSYLANYKFNLDFPDGEPLKVIGLPPNNLFLYFKSTGKESSEVGWQLTPISGYLNFNRVRPQWYHPMSSVLNFNWDITNSYGYYWSYRNWINSTGPAAFSIIHLMGTAPPTRSLIESAASKFIEYSIEQVYPADADRSPNQCTGLFHYDHYFTRLTLAMRTYRYGRDGAITIANLFQWAVVSPGLCAPVADLTPACNINFHLVTQLRGQFSLAVAAYGIDLVMILAQDMQDPSLSVTEEMFSTYPMSEVFATVFPSDPLAKERAIAMLLSYKTALSDPDVAAAQEVLLNGYGSLITYAPPTIYCIGYFHQDAAMCNSVFERLLVSNNCPEFRKCIIHPFRPMNECIEQFLLCEKAEITSFSGDTGFIDDMLATLPDFVFSGETV